MPPTDMPRALAISELREQLRSLEGGSRRTQADHSFTTGVPAFDALLPAAGWQPGSLIEWLADGPGSGAGTLALLAAKNALTDNGTVVVIDEPARFYPLACAGSSLEQLVLVRPASRGDACWALEQALRCRGVALTLCWLEKSDERVLRRLQLAAETGGGLGMLLRPARARGQPSWADVRLLVCPLPTTTSARRRWRLEVLACRGGASGGTVELEAGHEKGLVHLAAPLAPAAPARHTK